MLPIWILTDPATLYASEVRLIIYKSGDLLMTSLHNLHDWSVCSSSIAYVPQKIEWVYYNSVHTIPGPVIFYPLHQQVILRPFFLEEAVMRMT